MEGIGTIQRHIKENLYEYKKLNPHFLNVENQKVVVQQQYLIP
jgi:hypothetical protein